MDNDKPVARVLDVDGTACDVRPIRHYVTNGNRNFDAFHKASKFCEPNWWVIEQVRDAHNRGEAILVGTGRLKTYEPITKGWFNAYDIPYTDMRHRLNGDFRKDELVKLDMLTYWRRFYNIIGAWDDNPNVITNVWEPNGIPVTVVPGWDDSDGQ